MQDAAQDLTPDADPQILPVQEPEPPLEAARTLVQRLAEPDLWDLWLQRAILIVAALFVAAVILRIGNRLLRTLQVTRALPDAAMLPVRRLFRGLVLVLTLLIGLQLAGVPMTTVWGAVSGIVALIAIGFVAVWSVLSNAACSLLLLVFKPFRIGDHVELVENAAGPNTGGRVTDVTLMYVVLREEAAEGQPASFVQVPNNLFFQKLVRRRAGRRSIPLEQHVDKHGLTGREQAPPS